MVLEYGTQTPRPGPVRSTASIVAIVAAIGSFLLAFRGNEILALLAAGTGVLCGLVGALRAVSPHVTGGILSLAAILLSAIAVLVALVALVL